MYDKLVKRLRGVSRYTAGTVTDLCKEAADAIENLNFQRERAYARLCEWCGVCPDGKRNAEDCEIAALNPKPPKEET